MNPTLLNQMANDLNINKFHGECNEIYTTRVLYSAFSLWLKTICLDGVTVESQSSQSISKHYHHKRGEFILNNLLDFFPDRKTWFYNEDDDPPVNFMRERLIRSVDILEINDDSRLYLHKTESSPANSNLSKVFGLPNKNFDFFSGISMMQKQDNYPTAQSIETMEKFYIEYIRNICFTKDEWLKDKQYFDPFIRTNTIYQSWIETPPQCDLYVSRIRDGIGNAVYFWEKSVGQTSYSCRINEFIIESGILNKVLFYMRYIHNNPIYVEIEQKTDSFVLRRSVKNFYGEEETFIQQFGWPQKSLYDLLNWSFPICFYDDILNILKNLFLSIKEV